MTTRASEHFQYRDCCIHGISSCSGESVRHRLSLNTRGARLGIVLAARMLGQTLTTRDPFRLSCTCCGLIVVRFSRLGRIFDYAPERMVRYK